jgi:hypothetical protein
MTAETKHNSGIAAVILCLMAISYAAGTALASDPMSLSRLNLAAASITKARALLDAASPTTRAGVAHVSAAKQALDKALDQTQRAVTAEGG